MATYAFTWPLHPGASSYRLYRAAPGQPYQLDQEVAQPPAQVTYSLAPRNIRVLEAHSHRTTLAWDPPLPGFPESIKVVPVVSGSPLWTPSPDALWLSDALPTGSSWIDPAGVSSDPRRITGASSHRLTKPTSAYRYEWVLQGFSSPPTAGQYWVLWICLLEPPDCLYVAFRQGGSWEHRAYFGYDLLPWPEGTPAKRYMGELPSPGMWAGLVIPLAPVLDSQGTVDQVAFGVATEGPSTPVSWLLDSITVSTQPVLPPPVPLIGPSPLYPYRVRRSGYAAGALPTLDARVEATSFTDAQARDFSRRGPEDIPPLEIREDLGTLTLRWIAPLGSGTDYTYTVQTQESTGSFSDPVTLAVSVNDAWDRADVYVDTTWITTQPPVAANLTTNTYTYSPAQPDTLYFVRLVLKDPGGNSVFTLERTYRTTGSSRLGSWILGYSRLV